MKTFRLFSFFFLLVLILGNQLAAQEYQLKEIPDGASCFSYQVLDANHQAIKLPPTVAKALDCPSLVDLKGDILTYMDGLTVKLFHLKNRTDTKMFTMYEDMDGISNPAWSADRKQILFVIINQQRKHGYKSFTRLISINLDDTFSVLSKEKFDHPVNFACGGICSSEPYVDFFYQGNSIQYKRNINIDDRPGEFELIPLKNTSQPTTTSATHTTPQNQTISCAKVKKGENHGIIDANGNTIIPLQKNTINYLNNGLFAIQSFPTDTIVDARGKVFKILPKNAAIGSFRNNRAIYLEGNTAYLVNGNFEKIKKIPDLGFGVQSFRRFNEEGNAVVTVYQSRTNGKGLSGVINMEGEILIPYKYENEGSLQDDFWITTRGGKYGAVNLQNQIILPFEHIKISFAGVGKFKIKKQIAQFDSKYPLKSSFKIFWYDQEGNEFIKTDQYDYIYNIPGHSFYKVIKDKKSGLLDKDGLEILAPQFRNLKIVGSKDSFLWVQEDNEEWFYIDLSSKRKSKFIIKEFSNCEPTTITQGDDWYLLQMNNSCITDEQNTYLWKDGQLKNLGEFRYVGRFSGDVVFMNAKDKKYILTKDLKLVDVSQYDRVSDFEY